MFNVSKKTLSVVLCLALLASVVAVCFMTPATAQTITSTQIVPSYIDIPTKELDSPVVDLPFEGEETEKYGISFGRWTNEKLSYADGYPKLTCGGWWFFFGKDGSMGKPGESFYSFQGESNAATMFANAIEHLYTFEANKTYMVSFDVKALEGAAVNGTIKYGLNTNPAAGSNGDKTGMKDVSDKGFTLSATEEGSDWQTATTIFTVETAGKFGICPDIGGSITIDNFKVYDLTALRAGLDSTTQNKLTFDFGGFGVHRYGSVSIGTEEKNGNNYGILDASCSSAYFASTEYTNVYKFEGGAGDTSKHINMFKFEAGKAYEVSFKYRYADGQGVAVGTSPILRLMQSPAGAAHANDELLKENASWAQDIVVKGLELKNAPSTGKWQEVKVTFTVKAECTTGAYFGLGGNGKVLHVDDYQVKGIDLANTKTVTITTDYVSHDMEGEDVVAGNDAASGTFAVHQGSGASVIASGDEHGEVLNFTTGTRGTFQDVEIFEKGKKYYISFDARATSGNTNKNIFLGFAPLWGGDINTGSFNKPRYFINSNGSLGGAFDDIAYAFQFYVNGERTDIREFLLTDNWQRFGIVMDLTDEHVTTILEERADGTGLFNEPKCLYFGQSYSQYDNFTIVSTHDVEGAVPELDTIETEVSYRELDATGAEYVSAGLRFKASLPKDVANAAAEIGFIAAPSSNASFTENWYMIENGVNPIARKALVKDAKRNYIFNEDDTVTEYQLVVTGLSNAAGDTAYNRRFSVVMYTVDDNGNYTYYALGEASYYQALGIYEALMAE